MKVAILGCPLKLDIVQYLPNKKKLPAKDLLMLKFCKNYSTFVVLWEMLAKELFLSKDLGKTH